MLRCFSRVALVVALCVSFVSSHAIAQQFLSDGPASKKGDVESPDDPTVLRQRSVNVNVAALGDQTEIVLFDDMVVNAQKTREWSDELGSFWSGTTDEGGQVTISMVSGAVHGMIGPVDGRMFELRGSQDGYIVLEHDQSAYPEEEDIVLEPDPDLAQPSPTTQFLDDGTVMDLMVVYTPNVVATYGSIAATNAAVATGVTTIRDALANVGASHTINLVHAEQVSYNHSGNFSTDLGRLRGKSDGFMDGVHATRDQVGADFVAMWIEGTQYCGIGYVQSTLDNPGFEANAFTVTARSCAIGNYSFAHELGHNFGLQHDRYVNTSNNPLPEAHGYVNQAGAVAGSPGGDRWRTVMAYNSQCSALGFTCTRIGWYSNHLNQYSGATTNPMVIEGLSSAGNVLNRMALNSSNFRQTAVGLPVELVSFEARQVDSGVFIEWRTATETDNSGFSVQKRDAEGAFSEIGYVEGAGTIETAQEYTFKLAHVHPGLHQFRLVQIDFDGTSRPSNVVEVAVTLSGDYLVSEVYPNPSSGVANIGFGVNSDQDVRVNLITPLGQVVKNVMSGPVKANDWMSIQLDTSVLASGMYLLVVDGDRFRDTRPIVVTR